MFDFNLETQQPYVVALKICFWIAVVLLAWFVWSVERTSDKMQRIIHDESACIQWAAESYHPELMTTRLQLCDRQFRE